MPKADAAAPRLQDALDWGALGPLRLRARQIAGGLYAGVHRSLRRGAGVEFGGHRNYVPGDDLRWLDRRALMRHGRLLIREFETETDRALCLIVDGSTSMRFRSERGAAAKLAYAAVLAAALARVALAGGDPVSLDWIGGTRTTSLPPSGGREAFERVVAALESAGAGGDLLVDPAALDRTLAAVSRRAPDGAVIVLLSDLLDLPAEALDRFCALSTRRRTLLAVQVLDPVEAEFPFDGAVLLRSSEGDRVLETEAQAVRAGYLDALAQLARRWDSALTQRQGRLVSCTTADDPVSDVRSILITAAGGGP